MRAVLPALLSLLLALPTVAWPQPRSTEPAPVEATSTDEAFRRRLEQARDQLAALEFERALAAIETLLGEPGMSETIRAETLILRAQAHVAYGDLDAAEGDYREILRLRPGYEPATSLTPNKAMLRFEKVRRQLVGHLAVELEPPGARLSVDGAEVVVPPDNRLPLLAGAHVLRASSPGHDPLELALELPAGEETPVRLELVPNARTVVIRTQPEGVEVRVDGRSFGKTAISRGVFGVAELVIENLPLGEHRFELSRDCYRTERFRETLTVDLLDRSPRRMDVVRMVEERTPLVVRGRPAGAEAFLDGKAIGRLPLEQPACPGTRTLEVRAAGRTAWLSELRLDPGVERVVEVTPRPNLVLLGAADWPPPLADFAAAFNRLPPLAEVAGGPLADAAGWRAVSLPADADLAVAVVPGEREAAGERWLLYSPVLRTVQRLALAPEPLEPDWSRTVWGFSTVDFDDGVLVAEVLPGSAAAAAGLEAGARLSSIGGRPVRSSAAVRATLDAASADAPIEFAWISTGGEPGKAALHGVSSPHLVARHDSAAEAALRAAWAVVHATCLPASSAAPLANLALLFSGYGQHERAVETWRRVRWGERRGIGEGTTQYYIGCALEAAGRESEAVEAYRRAAASESTTFDDEGPPVGPAARDRLADLGR